MGKKISLGTSLTLILIAITITFTFSMVFSLNYFNEKVRSITERENMYAKFTEIDSIVRQNHTEVISENVLMDAVAKGYLSGINDPYTKYYNAEEYSTYLASSSQTVAGVGVAVTMDSDGYMHVDKVYDGSTAASAGIIPGDLIIKVDDINLTADNFAEAEALLVGDAGTKVTLTVRRDSEDSEMEITRRVVTPTTVNSTSFDIYRYIRVDTFSEGTSEQFSKAVEKAVSDGSPALIIDVRSVSEGSVEAAADMIDKFVGSSDLLYVEYSGGHTEVLFTSNTRSLSIPVIILVNESTSGAAEFFAAGLRDFGVAKIVGSQTAGIGSLQEIFKLDDGSAIKLTVGKYFLSNSNTSWEGTGVTPDHIVTLDYSPDFTDISMLDTAIDVQLAKALEVAVSSVSQSSSEENLNNSEGSDS